MRLGFMPNLSEDVANKENAIVQVISGFNKFLKDKDYGRGIDELVISINCLNPAHEGKISCSPPEYLFNPKELSSYFILQSCMVMVFLSVTPATVMVDTCVSAMTCTISGPVLSQMVVSFSITAVYSPLM